MMKYDRKYVSDEAVEKYDDARFALLMEGYASRLGEDYVEENIRLQDDESFELPSGLDEKCMKAIDSAIARKRRRENAEKAKKAAKRITVVAASFLVIIVLSSVVLFNTVEAFRVVVSDYVIELFDVGDGSLVSVESNKNNNHEEVSPRWLPTGYIKENEVSKAGMKMIRYSDGQNWITFTVHSDVSIGTTTIDTENATGIYNIKIIDYSGTAVEKSQETFLYWFAGDIVYYIWTDSTGLDSLIKIAESCYDY